MEIGCWSFFKGVIFHLGQEERIGFSWVQREKVFLAEGTAQKYKKAQHFPEDEKSRFSWNLGEQGSNSSGSN